MSYLWAALRTVAILVGLCAALYVFLLIAGTVVTAFAHSWVTGFVVLALACAVVALFGHQLRRVAKNDRAKLIGFSMYCGFGGVAATALLAAALVPLEIYLWAAAYLPVLRHFGIESPFARTGQIVAVVVFLEVFLIAPIGFAMTRITRE